MPSHNVITLNSNPTEDLPARGHVDIYYNPVSESIEAENWDGQVVPFGTFGTSAPLENSLDYQGTGRALSANQGYELDQKKVDKEEGKGLSEANFTSAEKTKLGGIEEAATANSTDAYLRNRDNHTGTQEIATVTGLETALGNRIEKMVDLETAPFATITSISVLYPGATEPVILIPANLPLTGDPYEDVDGRTPYTEDGTFENGGFYNNRINYSALANQWVMTLDSGEGVVGWDSHRADLTAVGVESWPWTSVAELPIPQITPTFTTDAPGIAGQRYRVKESQGRYRHYEKQPDNSILDLGLFDTLGNEFIVGTIIRRVPAVNLNTYVPLENEIVEVADTGCKATGDGLRTVKYLPWSGLHRIELDESYIESGLAEDAGSGSLFLFSNSGDVEVLITEDIKDLGFNSFEFMDYSRPSPAAARLDPINFKYAISCQAAQTGGSIQFARTMRYWNINQNIYNSGTETATLAPAESQYDYVDLPNGAYLYGIGSGVIYATPNAVFGGA